VVVMTVLKSDNANGLFGFDGPCRPAAVPMYVNHLNCTVRRDRGTYDDATVLWQIASVDSTTPVSQYFINYTGRISFSAEQTVAVSSVMRRLIYLVHTYSHGADLRKLAVQPDTSKHCKTMDTVV